MRAEKLEADHLLVKRTKKVSAKDTTDIAQIPIFTQFSPLCISNIYIQRWRWWLEVGNVNHSTLSLYPSGDDVKKCTWAHCHWCICVQNCVCISGLLVCSSYLMPSLSSSVGISARGWCHPADNLHTKEH